MPDARDVNHKFLLTMLSIGVHRFRFTYWVVILPDRIYALGSGPCLAGFSVCVNYYTPL